MKKSTADAPAGTPTPAPPKAQDKPKTHIPPRDKHTGIGGMYRRDPVTGERTKIERK